jgi:hypothetical protein
MIKHSQLQAGRTYKNKRGDRRNVLRVSNNVVTYKILEKNGRGPGLVGQEYTCKVDTFVRWVSVVL